MSMLAEQRRKTKWVINPTKKPIWATDSSGIKFGKQLMEKMGWSAGKGLGVNEQGMHEPLKVSFKNDTKGMGFKGNDDDWIEHQDEFNILLNQLRNEDSSAIKGSDAEKSEVRSLEEKSKQSKARVHYQKFTRGKDLSRYSENDLACILGTGKTKKKEKVKSEEVAESETKTQGSCETSFGVTTINSGSIHDYFKKKWIGDKVKSSGLENVAVDDEDFRPSFSSGKSSFPVNDEFDMKPEGEKEQSAKKNHKSKSGTELLNAEEDKIYELDNVVKAEKKKRKKRDSEINEEEPESKKKRKLCDENSCVVEENLPKEGVDAKNENSNKEKRRKDKGCVKNEIVIDVEESGKEKKKRKRIVTDNALSSEEVISTGNGDDTLNLQSVKRKNKKKDKKEKVDETEGLDNGNEIHSSAGDMNKSCAEVNPLKIKKKKKVKSDENCDATVTQDVLPDTLLKASSEEVVNVEISGTYLNGHTTGIEPIKKKKKKEKKEKIEMLHDTNPEFRCDNQNNKKFRSETSASGEINYGSETENASKLESRKKKKKTKREKLDEETENRNKTEESCLEGTEISVHYEGEERLESAKKKKKKEKKEKPVETENNTNLENEKTEEETTLDVDSVKRKKKKKHKKEKAGSRDEPAEAEESPVTMNAETENQDETIEKRTEVNGVVHASAEDRLQKLRVNLFPDKAADKYFPGQGTNERVLKLIRWANIAEFKGSNLNDVEGYGRRKLYEKQSR